MRLPFKQLWNCWLVLLAGGWMLTAARGADVAGDYLVDVWAAEDGLPDSSVTAIAQTPDGYLWIGTYNGLVRFDGVRFVTFDPANTPALGHARVQALSVDNEGTLWINTFDGSLTSLRQGTFAREWTGNQGMDPDVVRLVSSAGRQVTFVLSRGILRRRSQAGPAGSGWEDLLPPNPESGWLCIGDGAGMVWFRGGDQQLTRLEGRDFVPLPPTAGLPGSQINSLVRDPNGQTWVGTDQGVARWDGSHFQNYTPTNGVWPENTILLSVEANGTWLAAVDGHLQAGRDRQWLKANAVQTIKVTGDLARIGICADHRGGEWVYGYGLGLSHVATDGTVRHLSSQAGFPGDRVACFFEDREGNWWAGLDPGGLVRICEQRFRTLDQTLDGGGQISTRQAKSVCQESNGTVWIGTMGNGLVRGEAGTFTNLTVPGGTDKGFAFCICPDARGRVWVSAGEQDLYVLEQEELRRVTPAIHGVKVILADRAGVVWVGTKNGLYLAPGGAANAFTLDSGIGRRDVRALAEDGHGGLWVGTGEGALYHQSGGAVASYQPADTKMPQAIWSLLAEADGTVWAGTFRGGLLRWRDGTFTRYSIPEGLPDNIIAQILGDGAGNLWVGSHQGVFRVAKADLEAFASGGIKRVPCSAYGRSDGLPSLECSGGFQPAAWRALDGTLWFTTLKGAVSVKPQELRVNPLPPPVVIEGILIDGKSLEATVKPQEQPFSEGVVFDREKKILQVPPGKHQFEFRYTGLSLVSSDRMRFRYRLAGVDADWVEAGTRRSAEYNLLPAGVYQFQVKACNSDNVWNDTGDALTLKIPPYYYETWWFRLAAGLVAAGLVAGAVWYSATQRLHRKLEQLARQQAVERERARIAKDIHDDLGANLTLIARLGHLARQEKTAERIEKMEKVARQAVKSLDEIVWAVNPRNDTLAHLIDYSGQFATDYLYAAGLGCLLDLPEHAPVREVPSNVRHNVFLVIKEALQNIVKHARATEVCLRIHATAEGLRIVLEDNGCGFDRTPDDALADGLRNMQQRMHEIGGRCVIQSRAGTGTEIIAEMPWPRGESIAKRSP